MEMVVQKTFFEFSPNAMLLMRGAEDGTAMSFDIGDSSAKFYTGHDNAGAPTNLPTFGVTHAADKVVCDVAITKGATVEEVKTQIVDVDDFDHTLTELWREAIGPYQDLLESGDLEEERRLAYVARPPFRVRKGRRVTVLRVKDAYGNRIGGKARVRVGSIAPLEWPDNIGTGDGRTPGALGEGNFPP